MHSFNRIISLGLDRMRACVYECFYFFPLFPSQLQSVPLLSAFTSNKRDFLTLTNIIIYESSDLFTFFLLHRFQAVGFNLHKQSQLLRIFAAVCATAQSSSSRREGVVNDGTWKCEKSRQRKRTKPGGSFFCMHAGVVAADADEI